MAGWRKAALAAGAFTDLTLLLNSGGWVFDDAEPRYTIGLLTLSNTPAGPHFVRLRGPFRSMVEYARGCREAPVEITAEELFASSPSATIPLLPSPDHARVFKKLRGHPSLSTQALGWAPKGLRELNASDDREYFIFDREQAAWPVYKGESFDLWKPDTGSYYAYARPSVVIKRLIQRQLNQITNRRSAFYGLSREWAADKTALPARKPRIAWRDSTNRTNQRTMIAALVPSNTVLVHQAYYLFWRDGDSRDEAYVLGVVSSIPFDWYARQLVETHVTVEFVDSAPTPRVSADEPLRRRVEEIAGRLAAVDDRYAVWAEGVGVPVGSVTTETERAALVTELDAAVSLLYELDEDDVKLIFETFHEGWDYKPRLRAVLDHYRRLA
jgi:hypothetical protein